MTTTEFRRLLKKDREAALRVLFQHWVAEWMNDGEEEVARVLALWAARSTDDKRVLAELGSLPAIDLGGDEGILEEAAERGVFGDSYDSIEEAEIVEAEIAKAAKKRKKGK